MQKKANCRFFLFLSVLSLFFVSCATGPDSRDTARQLTNTGTFTTQFYDTSTFVLYGLLKQGSSTTANTLHVYLEGDGLAWISRSQPSADPTPTTPTTINMAKADPYSGPVLYLARPCQYVTGADARQCQQKYWTNARFAPEVIQSMDEAITQAKKQTQATHVSLVGYSGGGGVAALIAAKRDDVVFLGSVAGNLDHVTWTKHHRVSPLSASLNPLDAAPLLANIPQLHLSSPSDSIIPPAISAGFCKATGRPQACKTVPGINHDGLWENVWPWGTAGY